MSDTQFSIHQPVYPTAESRQRSTSEDEPGTVENAPPASTTPNLVEIDGRSYTEEQLKDYIGNGMMKADHTRKTQELARMREEYEDRMQEVEDLKAELQSQRSIPNPTASEQDEIGRILGRIDAVSNEFRDFRTQYQKREEERDRALTEIRADNELEEALDSLEGQPFFKRDEVAQVMKVNNLRPHQIQVAYNYLYAGKVGQAYGRAEAIRQGATARPPMGGTGDASISPGFSAVSELAKQSESLYQANGRMKSWKDFAKMAAADPEIP